MEYVLTDDDVALLKRICSDYLGGRLTAQTQLPIPRRPPLPTYVGVTDEDIDAYEVTSGSGYPGSGNVDIYGLDDSGYMSGEGLTFTAYNLGSEVVEGTNVGLIRDPFSGAYFIVPVPVTITNTCCPITLACCPQIWFPNTVYATITDTGGQCSCYAGSFALAWNTNGFATAWSAVVPITYAPGDCPGPSDFGPAQFEIILTPCYSGGNNWLLQMYCGLYDLFQLIVSGFTEPTCYPLSATFADLSNAGGTWGTCCVNVDTLTVVITA